MRALSISGASGLAAVVGAYFVVATSGDFDAGLLQPQAVALGVAAITILLGVFQAYLLLRSVFYAAGQEDSGRRWIDRRRRMVAGSPLSGGPRTVAKRAAFTMAAVLLSSSAFVGAVLVAGVALIVVTTLAATGSTMPSTAGLLTALVPVAVVVLASTLGRMAVGVALFPSAAVGRRLVAIGDLPTAPPSIRSLRRVSAGAVVRRLADPVVLIMLAVAIAVVVLAAVGFDGPELGVLVLVAIGHLALTNIRLFASSRGWWRRLVRASGVGPVAAVAYPRDTLPPTRRTLIEIITPIGPNSPVAELGGVLSDHRFVETAPLRWTVVTDPERIDEVNDFLRSLFIMHGAPAALDRVSALACDEPKAGPKRTLAARTTTAPFVAFIDADDRVDVSRLVAAASSALARPGGLQATHLFPFLLQTVDGLEVRQPGAIARAPLVHHHCARLWPSGVFQSGFASYGNVDFEDAIFTLEMAASIDHLLHKDPDTAFLTYADHKHDPGRLTRAYKDSSHLMRAFANQAVREAQRDNPPKPTRAEAALLDIMVGRVAAEVAWRRGPVLDGLATNLDEFSRYRGVRPGLDIPAGQIEASIAGVRSRTRSDLHGGFDRGLVSFIRDELAARRPRAPMLRDADIAANVADQQLGLLVGLMNADIRQPRTHETVPTVIYHLPGDSYASSRRAMPFFLSAPHFRLEVDESLPPGTVEIFDPVAKSRSRLGSFETDRLMSSKLLRLWDRFYPTINQVEQARSHIVLQSLAMRTEASVVRLVATGPSSQASLDGGSAGDGVLTICCNSWVRQPERMAEMGAKILTAGDPIFHAGPSEYARQFRADVAAWLRRDPEHLFVTVGRDIAIYLSELPEDVHGQIAAPVFDAAIDPVNPITIETGRVQPYPNVMTLLMLPMAELFQPAELHLFGFDGGAKGAEEYWKYDPETNYSEELQQTVRTWHPEFFRVDYQGYRDEHDEHVRSWMARLAAQDIAVRAAAPSNIPAVNDAYERSLQPGSAR